MHINDVVQLLSDNNGTLECRKGVDGLVYIRIFFPEHKDFGEYVEVAGFKIDDVLKYAKKRIDRRRKYGGSIRITSGGGSRA